MGNRSQGIYHKFNVTRMDGSHAPGGKHEACFYFVLDCDHDPHARPALEAYAKSCRTDGYEELADEIEEMLGMKPFGAGMETIVR